MRTARKWGLMGWGSRKWGPIFMGTIGMGNNFDSNRNNLSLSHSCDQKTGKPEKAKVILN